MTPKVSIIIPVYNAAPYIEQCYKSISSQTFTDWEVIFVNDGSTDNSEDLCNKIAISDSKVTVISTKNSGVSTARNIGLSAATGEYVTFVDVDDYLGEAFLTTIAKADEDLIITQYLCFDEDNNTSDGENVKPVPSTSDAGAIRSYLAEYLHQNIMRTPWGKFFRRDIIKDLRFPKGQKIGEDSVFVFNALARIKSIKTVGDVFYMWRTHKEFFIEKYQMPVDTAIQYLVNELKAYRNIGVSSPHLEMTLYCTFFALSEKSIKLQRWKWFSRPAIINIWESIDFDYKNIHRKKFKKYRCLTWLYRFLDYNRFK